MTSKPTTAFALSLVGGIFVLLGGLSVMMLGAILSFLPILGKGFALVGDIGALCGVVMLVGGALMYVMPDRHLIWGILVLVFSILSWVGAIGGFAIGFLLGLVGGILGIVWKPSGVAVNVNLRNVASQGHQQAVTQMQGTCSNCGSPLPSGARVCSACGGPA